MVNTLCPDCKTIGELLETSGQNLTTTEGHPARLDGIGALVTMRDKLDHLIIRVRMGKSNKVVRLAAHQISGRDPNALGI